MIEVGIIGATGYVGQQLVGLVYKHPNCNINFMSSNTYAGKPFSDVYGQYKGVIDMECIETSRVGEHLSNLDLVFVALPHGMSFEIVKTCIEKNIKVIDIGADFRLKDVNIYKDWYELDHQAVELNEGAVYGLPEIYGKEIKNAWTVANPGCYPTATILGLMPLLKTSLIDKSSIIIDGKSGVSGAGRSAKVDSLYGEVNESSRAYSVASHRHTPEIEQELSSISKADVKISFTPHLLPMNRGILITSYVKLEKEVSQEDLYRLYRDEYKGAPFIRVIDDLPQTKWVRGSNFCDIALRVDKRTGRVIVLSAIDNMMKGAAGQAIQNLNIMFGLDEGTGLTSLPMIP